MAHGISCGCDLKVKGLLSRRQLLRTSGLGFGSLALAFLMKDQLLADAIRPNGGPAAQVLYNDLKPRPCNFPAPAKAVIQLFQTGGPSQIDMFDPKPELTKRDGQRHPRGLKTDFSDPSGDDKAPSMLFGSPFKFKHYGKCGLELSEIIPHMGGMADELCVVRSMFTEHDNHPEGQIMLQTCKTFLGRPAMGAWISYALGTENQNLPAYVVLRDPSENPGKAMWSSGFLPALFEGVEFRSKGIAVDNLAPSLPLPPGVQSENLALLSKLNQENLHAHPRELELESRIQNFELAARMQLTAPEVVDISEESDATRTLYGLDNPVTANYGERCLMARRLVEAGVRFVQVFPPKVPFGWDHHSEIKTRLEDICPRIDQPTAALIQDLKQRGLLSSTIILWTGEFGRMPLHGVGPEVDGCNHNRYGFSLVLAGGGFKGGLAYGETDEFGHKAVVNPVSVPDLHVTVLHQLGIDHAQLSYPYHGADETPTDTRVNKAKVVKDLFI